MNRKVPILSLVGLMLMVLGSFVALFILPSTFWFTASIWGGFMLVLIGYRLAYLRGQKKKNLSLEI